MAFVKQFLTKTRPSENTTVFRYSPVLSFGQVEIYCLLSISNTVEAETSRFNKFVWDGFLDGFLSKEEDIISRLKNALIGAEFKLKELIRHDSVLEEKGVSLDLSVLIFKEEKVFVGILGRHKVYLFRKKLLDLSDLLEKNKSTVGSMISSPKDTFVAYYGSKGVKSEVVGLNGLEEVENYFSGIFDGEGLKGGCFVATFEEEKVIVEKVDPVVVEKIEEKLPVMIEDAEVKEQEDFEVKKDKVEKFKNVFSLFLNKLAPFFDKLVTFLSSKLSLLFEKLKYSLRNKYGRKRWFKKLQSSSSVRRFAQGIKPFKVDGYKEKELRTRRFVMFFVLLVLIFSLFLGVRSAYESRQRSLLSNELSLLMEEWDGSVDEAERKALGEREEALIILSEVSEDLEKYLDSLKEEGVYIRLGEENVEKIDLLKSNIAEVQDKANRIVGISEEDGDISLFVDTKILLGEKSDPVSFVISKGSQIIGGERLYLIDKGEKGVYQIMLSDGSYIGIPDSGGLVANPLHIDLGNNRDDEALYVYDVENGVLRAPKNQEGQFTDFKGLSGLTPRTLGGDGVAAFAVFGPTDSLNFLVPAQSRIIRATSFGGTIYNLPSEFISHPSFEKGTDLFGDQYIYVLSTTPNGIKRFVPSTGLNSQLAVTGLEQDLHSIVGGYTGATMNRTLILFDSELQRFLQFSKPIEMGFELVHPNEIVLVAQYEYRGERDDVFNDVKSFALTDDDKHMYVLDGKKIWKINLE